MGVVEKSIAGTERGREDYSGEIESTTVGIPRLSQQVVYQSLVEELAPNDSVTVLRTPSEGNVYVLTDFYASTKGNALIGLALAFYVDDTRVEIANQRNYNMIHIGFHAGISPDEIEATLTNYDQENTREIFYSHFGMQVPEEYAEVII